MKTVNKILLVFILCSNYQLNANNKIIKKILPVIKHIESNNNVKAIGDNGKALGILQIHKICVDDVNRIYGTNYTHEDALDEVCANEIFELTIKQGIKIFYKKYKKEPSVEQVVRMWNGGIYSGYKKKSTEKYYLKFKAVYYENSRKEQDD